MTDIDHVVCVASLSDLDIWRHSHHYILNHIGARHYTVYVPAADLLEFRAATDARFGVSCELEVLDGEDKTSIASRLPDMLKPRAGWYLQQFVKLRALRQGGEDAVNLIWDADTLPVRNLQFVTEGRLLVYKAREYHQPYFDTIQRLTGLHRTVDYSFIAQCLAVKKHWVDDLCHLIEMRTGMDLIEAVMSNLDHKSGSEFSEYETLGTYMSVRHEKEYTLTDHQWERYGYSLFNGPQKLSARKVKCLSKYVDFVAFEKWDRRKRLHSRIARRAVSPYWYKTVFAA
ncbi:DUF6492 family protein [Hoeflea prorocentri]|uniref:DUF6492 family protein n=1 Tax=Hoeflea prorocentri TaxID=1922333 RepID=A0A9X3UHB4_9HYPH|nr:DUF6492 family protein [Hoeflea prorocentri]MCY6380450.1 DUF6492 family protein [Hoeflea prorocentri]MDA5398250.1 DUF6492 family protein [Hoeflea prorocentri]